MATAVQNQFSLTSEELKDMNRLEKAWTAIVKEHSALTAKHAAAVLDLGEANARHEKSCVALASGDRDADVEGCATEVRRLEALIEGYTQLINAKNAELDDTDARITPLKSKQVSLTNTAEQARLQENLDHKVKRIEQLKEDMRQAEEERHKAAGDLGNFVSSLQPKSVSRLL